MDNETQPSGGYPTSFSPSLIKRSQSAVWQDRPDYRSRIPVGDTAKKEQREGDAGYGSGASEKDSDAEMERFRYGEIFFEETGRNVP